MGLETHEHSGQALKSGLTQGQKPIGVDPCESAADFFRKRKRPPRFLSMAVIYVGDDLLSHALSLLVRGPCRVPHLHMMGGGQSAPAGLDFRVRDGNGCFARGKITGFAGVCVGFAPLGRSAWLQAGLVTPIFH